MKRLHITISGRVTGVFFRDFVGKNALDLKVKGWVKNVGGEVEAVFEGEDENVDKLIELCKKGPESASVDNVEVKEEEYAGEFSSFEILY